jgi:hypothetical protein
VLVVFGFGVVLTAVVAVLYAAIAMDPTAASSGLDAATVRTGSTVLAVVLGLLCVVQSVAIGGLVRGQDWGRIAATAACVMWSATCVGIPLAALVLTSLWRRRHPPAAPRTSF